MANRVKAFFSMLGPGLVTGASDDDPSGISTYSIAGATTGFGLLWVILITTPMMAVIQGMCARIAMVQGDGLAATMRRRFAPWLFLPLVGSVVIANTINAGADLQGMGAAAELVVPRLHVPWAVIFGALLIAIVVFLSYERFASIVKWLTVALFAYVVTAFAVHPPWGRVLAHFVLPEFHLSATWITTILAVMGTTITPYLFFWQAALEVEEEIRDGRTSIKARKGASPDEIRTMHVDVNAGMIFSNVVAAFIIVTTAATLFGHSHITSAADAARALEPLAGKFAAWLFALGMVGTGLLAVPALVGSSAYVASEALRKRGNLHEKPARAPFFYGIVAAGIVAGMAMEFFHVDPIGALFWSAVINGVVAVPLLIAIVVLASDKRVVKEWTASPAARAWGWATVGIMALAAIGMFAFWGKS